MNFYSSNAFCEAFAAAYFPEEQLEFQWFTLQEQHWKIPVVNGTQPITNLPFQSKMVDFFEAVKNPKHLPEQEQTRPLRYLPCACQDIIAAEQWLEQPELAETYEPAPLIRWSEFESWDDFLLHIRQRKSKKFLADSRRRRRKLEEAVGELTFVLDDRRPEILKTCMAWKSEQYVASGEFDDFSQVENVRLFEELARRGLLRVSSLSSEAGAIAIDINLFYEGRLYSWIASYDRHYSAYAPGRLLLLEALEESFNQDHTEFDLMIGNEPYKWAYATHTRLIGALGTPSGSTRAKGIISSSLKPLVRWGLKPFPQIKGKLKTLALLSAKDS